MKKNTTEPNYKQLAEDLYEALASLTLDVRSWTWQAPSRASVVVENIRSSKVTFTDHDGKRRTMNRLEYAEHREHQYREAHPNIWSDRDLAACRKNETPIGTRL